MESDKEHIKFIWKINMSGFIVQWESTEWDFIFSMYISVPIILIGFNKYNNKVLSLCKSIKESSWSRITWFYILKFYRIVGVFYLQNRFQKSLVSWILKWIFHEFMHESLKE